METELTYTIIPCDKGTPVEDLKEVRAGLAAYWAWKNAGDSSPSTLVIAILTAANQATHGH